MISQPILLLSLAAFLGGGSIHGVVVDKTYKALPLAASLGVNGIYRLDLRQPDRSVRHQMVSPEIYFAYQIGDEFNDRLTVAEVRERRQAQAKKAAEEAQRLAAKEAKPAAKQIAADDRFPVLLRRQDMLPETEGF